MRSRRRSGSGAGCFLQLQIAGERDGTSCEGEASVLLSTLLTHEEMPVSIALNEEDKKVFAKAKIKVAKTEVQIRAAEHAVRRDCFTAFNTGQFQQSGQNTDENTDRTRTEPGANILNI